MTTFLENKEWTHLFRIDSDIGFSPYSFYRLLLADKDVVAGIYPLKRENWPKAGVPAGTTQADFERMYTFYTVNTSDQDENGEIVLKVDEDGFMKVHDAPTGFMVIKRSVFEKMMAAYPELNYISDSDYNRENKGPHYRFFDCMVDQKSKRYLSEDYTFCHLWRQLDGDVYVDVQSNLTHQGAKVYRGSFAESLQTNVANAVFAPERHTDASRTGCAIARQSARRRIKLADRQTRHFNSACLPPYNAYRFLFRRPQGRLNPSYSGETI